VSLRAPRSERDRERLRGNWRFDHQVGLPARGGARNARVWTHLAAILSYKNSSTPRKNGETAPAGIARCSTLARARAEPLAILAWAAAKAPRSAPWAH